jgi:vesicle coat complex subunit
VAHAQLIPFRPRYASEVDVDFVRKSIKAIGQTAVKIDEAAERCVNVLLDLIASRVSYVVQEAVVVMKVRQNPSHLRLSSQRSRSRTFSGNTLPLMKALFLLFVRTSMS